ncbi:helix-turn-helix transcriptional regulator [Paracoccus sp. NSM]|uniref:helix-turn-helix transcriptional regulator n=1 Tax=Paracoccus sp. NSM TaxID=3457784 RepID=UPI0040370910
MLHDLQEARVTRGEKTTETAPIVMAFAAVLKRLRRDAGLSQSRLAEASRVSLRYVAALEAASYQPSITVMQNLARVLGLPLSEMMRLVEQELAALENGTSHA